MTTFTNRMRKAIGLRPKRTGGHFQLLGDEARDNGDWDAAVAHYRNFLTHNPRNFAIWVQLGHVSKEAGDMLAAEQAYMRALSMRPSDWDLLLNLGHLAKLTGRREEAAQFYTRSAESDPTGAAERELAAMGRAARGDDFDDALIEAAVAPNAEPSPYLRGAIEVPERREDGVPVILLEGGREVARTLARGGGLRLHFAFRLPPELCDGRPHAFEVAADGEVVLRAAVITPAQLTPSAILADHAGRALRASLSPVAQWRYAALAEQAERAMSGAVAWGDIAAAHRFLVEGATRAGLDRSYAPLAFPQHEAPVASVVIPVHGKFDFTYRCLASLLLMPCDASFEVIVVDDGSADRTLELAALVSGIRVVRHEAAQGFVASCNDGAAAARGDYVVMLNNDTEVSPHWLDRLIEPFGLYDDVGLVGAKLVYADGRLQEAGGLVFEDGSAANYGRLGSVRDPRYNFLRETDYCSGACILLERRVWEELSGFDPAFAPAYYEDTDLAFRVRARGLRVLYQPLAPILHFEGVSNGQDVSQGVKHYQVLHEPIFLERWRPALRGNGTPAADGLKAIERTYPRQALVIDTEVPQPDRSAGHHAAVQEIRLLQSLGFRVTFLPLNLAYLGRYNDLLAAMGVEAIHSPFYLSAEDYLAAHAGRFDLIYITRYSVAADLLPLVRQHNPKAPVVFNNADLHFLRAIRDAIDAPGEGKRAAAEAIRDAELEVMRNVDLTLSYNPVEHAVIQSHAVDEVKVALCPWIVEPRPAGPGFAEREGIAFLGGYRHPPNRRAVEYFVGEVMPLLRAARPGIRFHVYGSHVPPEFQALAGGDVVIEGYVETVEQALDAARLFVAPLRAGAGIKGKVLEALASGVPSILSPIAAEGTGVRDGMEAAIAETPEDWVTAILSLYDDPARWQRMADAARAFVETGYSFERGRTVMQRALESVAIPTSTGLTCRSLPRITAR